MLKGKRGGINLAGYNSLSSLYLWMDSYKRNIQLKERRNVVYIFLPGWS
jgi:hypothetical protein